MPAQRIRLKALSPTADSTGIYGQGDKGQLYEYPVGHVLTLPEGMTLETSEYANRAEAVDGEKTGDHVATTALEGDPNGGAEKPTPLGETEKAKIEAGEPSATAAHPEAAHSTADLSIKKYSAAPTDSPGWWVITDQDGNEVGKKVRPSDGTDFNDLDDAGKAKFIADQGA